MPRAWAARKTPYPVIEVMIKPSAISAPLSTMPDAAADHFDAACSGFVARTIGKAMNAAAPIAR